MASMVPLLLMFPWGNSILNVLTRFFISSSVKLLV